METDDNNIMKILFVLSKKDDLNKIMDNKTLNQNLSEVFRKMLYIFRLLLKNFYTGARKRKLRFKKSNAQILIQDFTVKLIYLSKLANTFMHNF